MSYSDPRHCHHQRVTQWLAAVRQHAAWLYAADEQYLYLVAEANELYQCGVVGLQDRHDMVTDALGMYGWAIERRHLPCACTRATAPGLHQPGSAGWAGLSAPGPGA